MQVALIPPACRLREVYRRPIEMIIPDALKVSIEYNRYYEQLARDPVPEKFLILDNGAFEEHSIGMLQLLNLARKYRVDEIVAPDVPGDMYATMNELDRFLELLDSSATHRVHPFRVMVAITGTTLGECKEFITYIAKIQKAGGVQTIGLPKHLAVRTKHPGARPGLARWINREYDGLFAIHALGYNWPGEAEMLAGLGVRSMDTDAPFRSAYHKVVLESGLEFGDRPTGYWIKNEAEFDQDLVARNIRSLDGWARYNSTIVC